VEKGGLLLAHSGAPQISFDPKTELQNPSPTRKLSNNCEARPIGEPIKVIGEIWEDLADCTCWENSQDYSDLSKLTLPAVDT